MNEQQQKQLSGTIIDNNAWIEWKGGECPVSRGTLVDVKYCNGAENNGVSAMTYGFDEDHVDGSNPRFWAAIWHHDGSDAEITAYRIHNAVK